LAVNSKKIILGIAGFLMGGAFLAPPLIAFFGSIFSPTATADVAVQGGEDGSLLQKQAAGYEVVLKREPNNTNALMGLVEVRRKQGRTQEAIALLEQAESYGDPSLTMSLAQLYQQTGQTPKALAAYDRILLLIPDWVPALLGKAITLKMAGQTQAAQELYVKALAKAPEDLKPQVIESFTKAQAPATTQAPTAKPATPPATTK